jgi:hypothetical protein
MGTSGVFRVIAVRRLLLLVMIAALPAQAGMLETTKEQEAKFVPLTPPEPYSYEAGTVTRHEENGKRYVNFVGTTAMPPYFADNKNSLAFERAAWQKQLLLSKGRWVFQYSIDCSESTFDRDGDMVGWRKTYFDPTAFVMMQKFCTETEWATLPLKKQ